MKPNPGMPQPSNARRARRGVVVHALRRAMPLAALALVAWGCDDSPAAPPLADATDAVGAMAAHWAQLASMEELHLATAGVLASGAPQQQGVAEAVVLAGMLAAEAGGAGITSSEARALADDPWVEITTLRLGTAGVAQYLGGVNTAFRAVEAAASQANGGQANVSQAAGGAEVHAALAEARHALATAESALASGQPAAALAAASRGSDALRAMSPAERAAAFVAATQQLLARATALAGEDPSPEIRALLNTASNHCQAAGAALDAGDVREAVRHAQGCARISRMVIVRLSGGLPNEELADRAEAAVEQAAALFERATEVVGGSPPPHVQEALDEARSLLGKAQSALGAGNLREAIRAAHASGALSRRVIAWARTPGIDGLEGRALAALETARELLTKAGALAGPTPSPAIQTFLVSAARLVDEATVAFQRGDFRSSLARSLEATGLLRRAIHLLS